MANQLFTDRYFEKLLDENPSDETRRLSNHRSFNALESLRFHTAETSEDDSEAATSAFRVYDSSQLLKLPPSTLLNWQPRQQSPRPKRHQRPAHKEAEMRRLFKIREGIHLLTEACGFQRDRHVSEAATLRECRERIIETERLVVMQREEIDRLKRSLTDSVMPSGQAIDYVQTKWLESPKFELFYKLVGKTVTDAFLSHVQERASESFPEQWLARVRQEDLVRRSVRYFGRMRPACQN